MNARERIKLLSAKILADEPVTKEELREAIEGMLADRAAATAASISRGSKKAVAPKSLDELLGGIS